MNPLPAPNVPGNTEWERFDNAVSKLLSVPKTAFQKADARWRAKNRKNREKKRAKMPGYLASICSPVTAVSACHPWSG